MRALEQIRALYEYNEWANNHVLEAAFKSMARALGDACRLDGGDVPSTKGTL